MSVGSGAAAPHASDKRNPSALDAYLFQTSQRTSRARAKVAAMTGGWSGEYSYNGPSPVVVPFNANLREIDGVIDGEIDEPNTFADPATPILYANISGWRAGVGIHFVKKYNGVGGVDHAVLYDGVMSADSTRIDGHWRIGSTTGPFHMERNLSAAVNAEERAAQAEG